MPVRRWVPQAPRPPHGRIPVPRLLPCEMIEPILAVGQAEYLYPLGARDVDDMLHRETKGSRITIPLDGAEATLHCHAVHPG